MLRMAKSLATWAGRNDLNVYARNAGPTLSGLLSKAAEMGTRRLSLDDEIDLARAMVMRACAYWNAALENKDSLENPEALTLQCERLVSDAVETVVSIVHQAAKIRMMDEGAVQLSSVGWVIGEVTKVIEDEVRSVAPDLADKITDKISKIQLPVDGTLDKFMQRAADEAFL